MGAAFGKSASPLLLFAACCTGESVCRQEGKEWLLALYCSTVIWWLLQCRRDLTCMLVFKTNLK